MAAKVVVPDSGGVYYAEDGTASVVLEDNYDATYVPSEKEVLEYAQWLGMDPDDHAELLWIARKGLQAPLPDNWKPCKTDTGEVYYFNFATGESLWDHPMDEHFKELFAQEKAKLEETRRNKAGGGKKGSSKEDAAGKAKADKVTIREDADTAVPKTRVGGLRGLKTLRPAGEVSVVTDSAMASILSSQKSTLAANKLKGPQPLGILKKADHLLKPVLAPSAGASGGSGDSPPPQVVRKVSVVEGPIDDDGGRSLQKRQKELQEEQERELEKLRQELERKKQEKVKELEKQTEEDIAYEKQHFDAKFAKEKQELEKQLEKQKAELTSQANEKVTALQRELQDTLEAKRREKDRQFEREVAELEQSFVKRREEDLRTRKEALKRESDAKMAMLEKEMEADLAQQKQQHEEKNRLELREWRQQQEVEQEKIKASLLKEFETERKSLKERNAQLISQEKTSLSPPSGGHQSEEQHNRLQKEHEATIQRLTDDFERKKLEKLKQLEMQFEEDIAAERQRQSAQLLKERARLERETSEQLEEVQRELRADLDRRRAEKEREAEKDLAELEKSLPKKSEAVQENFESEAALLNSQASSELARLKQKLDEQLQLDLKRWQEDQEAQLRREKEDRLSTMRAEMERDLRGEKQVLMDKQRSDVDYEGKSLSEYQKRSRQLEEEHEANLERLRADFDRKKREKLKELEADMEENISAERKRLDTKFSSEKLEHEIKVSAMQRELQLELDRKRRETDQQLDRELSDLERRASKKREDEIRAQQETCKKEMELRIAQLTADLEAEFGRFRKQQEENYAQRMRQWKEDQDASFRREQEAEQTRMKDLYDRELEKLRAGQRLALSQGLTSSEEQRLATEFQQCQQQLQAAHDAAIEKLKSDLERRAREKGRELEQHMDETIALERKRQEARFECEKAQLERESADKLDRVRRELQLEFERNKKEKELQLQQELVRFEQNAPNREELSKSLEKRQQELQEIHAKAIEKLQADLRQRSDERMRELEAQMDEAISIERRRQDTRFESEKARLERETNDRIDKMQREVEQEINRIRKEKETQLQQDLTQLEKSMSAKLNDEVQARKERLKRAKEAQPVELNSELDVEIDRQGVLPDPLDGPPPRRLDTGRQEEFGIESSPVSGLGVLQRGRWSRERLQLEYDRVKKARAFLSEQRKSLMSRQAVLQRARENWQQDVQSARSTPHSSSHRDILRRVHQVLESQAKGLNEDAVLLQHSEEWLKLREKKIKLIFQHLDLEDGEKLGLFDVDETASSVISLIHKAERFSRGPGGRPRERSRDQNLRHTLGQPGPSRYNNRLAPRSHSYHVMASRHHDAGEPTSYPLVSTKFTAPLSSDPLSPAMAWGSPIGVSPPKLVAPLTGAGGSGITSPHQDALRQLQRRGTDVVQLAALLQGIESKVSDLARSMGKLMRHKSHSKTSRPPKPAPEPSSAPAHNPGTFFTHTADAAPRDWGAGQLLASASRSSARLGPDAAEDPLVQKWKGWVDITERAAAAGPGPQTNLFREPRMVEFGDKFFGWLDETTHHLGDLQRQQSGATRTSRAPEPDQHTGHHRANSR